MTEAHYLSMLVIGVGSFICGIFPVWFSLRTSRSYPLFLSLILCFGAGVLLSTSLVHMLTEVQEKLKLLSQLYFCGGFLLLFTFDEITHSFLGNKKPEAVSNPSTSSKLLEGERLEVTDYGATRDADLHSETSRLLDHGDDGKEFKSVEKRRGSHLEFKGDQNDESGSSYIDQQNHQTRCHTDIGEPCPSNPTAKTGLLIALLIHSILEGMSIGVQTETSQVYLILGAVTFHKIVLSFCLGLELFSNGYKHLNILLAIFLFSIGSPIGIVVGMSVTSSNGIFAVDAQLQAVAAGSLLYVAAFEVLPRERFKWQHRNNQRAAGMLQLIFVLIGFSCITALHLFIAPLHEHEIFNNNVTIKSIN